MVLSTVGVAADVTPCVIETFFSHYLNRKPLKEKPTAHISYHEGLNLIRQFLTYASEHTVEDVQAFTAQWVPCPTWVSLEEVVIADSCISRAADLIEAQLGPKGIELVGGKNWWQWRRPEIPLKADWLEMKNDLHERKAQGKEKSDRILLYVHGGAYYFGSTGEHRYQMQRHARKLKAQILAPEYRLAPQFPFPCGLQDCIATYLFLIQDHDPRTILLGGDSAGGGMVLSMLVALRDQGIPLPAGAILLSPWVDLTHSFPSVAGDGKLDYIPAMGFHHKPSMAWPPPKASEMPDLSDSDGSRPSSSSSTEKSNQKRDEADAAQGVSVRDATSERPLDPERSVPKPGQNLTIELDGKHIEIEDQIQMYAPNHLLAHPLVSPVMQPSLGGLPPLLIQVGGGELLQDEQVYIAHKAANPAAYPPPSVVTREWDLDSQMLHRYKPTKVQLQVWDDLCHVPHTLSFTRPAKYMYRGVAQFGAWALAHAQDRPVAILDDDDISIISSGGSSSEKEQQGSDSDATGDRKEAQSAGDVQMRAHRITTSSGAVGKAGDPLPPFINNMIRQRVDRHGMIFPLLPAPELPGLQMDRNSIGVIKPGPVRKWLAKKLEWDTRFARGKRRVQKTRLKELRKGYDVFAGETPPPTALAGRRQEGMMQQLQRQGKSWAMAMWSGWGSKHDESTIERRQKFGRRPTLSVALPEAGTGIAATRNPEEDIPNAEAQATASDADPASARKDSNSGVAVLAGGAVLGAAGVGGVLAAQDSHKVQGSENTYLSSSSARPHNGTVAYPFKLHSMPAASASMATLNSRDIDYDDASRPSSPPGDERVEGASVHKGNEEGNEPGGHHWLMAGIRSHLHHHHPSASDPRSAEPQDGSTHRSPAAGTAAVFHETANTTDPTRPDNHAQDTESTEPGSHAWLMSGHNKGHQPSPNEQSVAENSHLAPDAPRRPPLDTFVTAREEL
ncbi:hypothetical protein AAFC00_004254 [Neodothiora populina]|uniref:Alpha/beta hydrolase fold-3 domain-containing protein n=1 Tax=Neodothiora populina TaxID=2781224 RepID=A0ABR3PJB7_9PEZI